MGVGEGEGAGESEAYGEVGGLYGYLELPRRDALWHFDLDEDHP